MQWHYEAPELRISPIKYSTHIHVENCDRQTDRATDRAR